MNDYEQHEIGKLWRPLTSEELTRLKASANNPGVKSPIILLDGKILDGWHWYQVCKELGLEATFEELPENVDPYEFVMNRHEGRRNLSSVERAELADKWAIFQAGDNQHTKEVGPRGRTSSLTVDEAAKKAKTSPMQVKRLRHVKREGIPELQEALKNGALSLAKASEIAQLSHSEQKEHLRRLETHCPNGHEWTAENTYHHPNGDRQCKACNKERKGKKKQKPLNHNGSSKPSLRSTLNARVQANCSGGLKLTREQVDPDFKGTDLEWVDTYGHVQIQTKAQMEADRKQQALRNWLDAMNELRDSLRKYKAYLDSGSTFDLEILNAWLAVSEIRQKRVNEIVSLLVAAAKSIEPVLPLLK